MQGYRGDTKATLYACIEQKRLFVCCFRGKRNVPRASSVSISVDLRNNESLLSLNL